MNRPEPGGKYCSPRQSRLYRTTQTRRCARRGSGPGAKEVKVERAHRRVDSPVCLRASPSFQATAEARPSWCDRDVRAMKSCAGPGGAKLR
jgi:hypothetical protein